MRHTNTNWHARPFPPEPQDACNSRVFQPRHIKGEKTFQLTSNPTSTYPRRRLEQDPALSSCHHASFVHRASRTSGGNGPAPRQTQQLIGQPHPGRDSRGHGGLCGCDSLAVESALRSLDFMALQGKCYAILIQSLDLTRQMLVIAFHEFGHAITSCCTGGRVKSISLDPHEGGVTIMQGGISAITLPAGYLGSSIIGALLIFAGFDIVASKIASIVLGVCFLLTLWWARKDWLTIMTIFLAVGLLVACWFIAHGEALRWVVVS